jgi:AraC-like DNA-binding protein
VETSINFYSSILLIGAAQGLFLSLVLINSRGNKYTTHRFLAFLILTFVIDMMYHFLLASGYYREYLAVFTLIAPFDFLFGPFLWLYTCSLTSHKPFKFQTVQWLHFIPFAIHAFSCWSALTLDYNQRLDMFNGNFDGVSDGLKIQSWFLGYVVVAGSLLQVGFYIVLCFKKLTRHRRSILNEFSNIDKISLNWLRSLLAVISFLYISYFFIALFDDVVSPLPNQLLQIAVVTTIYIMGYLGLRQPMIFSPAVSETDSLPAEDHQLTINDSMAASEKQKYEKSALDADMSLALLDELQSHMVLKKSYLDGNLNLLQFSAELGISSNYLSQVINEQLGKNFFDFINGYRVEEAKLHLSNPQKRNANILTIALDSGFNSKSAFYSAFKKHLGMTPGQFRKSLVTD